MPNTELSEFFNLVSQEKNENEARLKEKISNPESDLANLFEQLESAHKEITKVSEEVSEEKVLTEEDQNRLESFSNLITSFDSVKKIPQEVLIEVDSEPVVSDVEPELEDIPETIVKTDNIIQNIVNTLDDMGERTQVKEEIDQISSIRKEFEKFKSHVQQHISNQGMSGAGSGEVRLEFLDDVQSSTAKVDGKFLKYSSSDGKWVGATAASGSSAADDISAGDAAVNITTTSGNITIDAAANNTDIIFKGTDASSDITMLTLDGSEAGAATFNDKVVATELDISGDVDVDGTLEADAYTVDGTTLAEYIADTAGAMVSSNTETGVTVTYQDGDNTIDFAIDAAQTTITSLLATDIKIGEDDQTKVDFGTANEIHFYADNANQIKVTDGAIVPASDNDIDLGTSSVEFKDAFFDGTVTSDAFAGPLTGDVTGNADTATTLASARTIGGVSFDGSANINLPGVNASGSQDTSGTAATVTVTDSTANTNFPVVFHDESNALLDDTGALRYNPSTGELLVPKLTVAGTTTTVDTVTMQAANAIIFEGATADAHETTLSIVDPTGDHTQYLINQGGYVPLLAAATTTAITSTPAELNLLDGSSANSVVNSKAVIYGSSGELAGTLSTAAQANVTSLGTLTALTVDNVVINGATIGHGDDTDLMTVADGVLTVAGELDAATLDISGNADIDGTLEADAYTVDGTTLAEYIADTAGAMVSSNTETGITVTYQDGDNTIDFAVDAAQTGITSIYNTSLAIGYGSSHANIDFGTDNRIVFDIDGTSQILLLDGVFRPTTDSDVDLGSSAKYWKDAYIDTITTTGAITSGGILKTDDTTEATSTTDGSLQTDGGLSVVKDAVFGDDVKLLSDAAVLSFGANSEITLTHSHDSGLLLKHTATADDKPINLVLQTGETDMAANDVIGKISFQAPDEGTGTDAILVSAAIQARAEGDHSSSSNATSIDFMTGASEAAATKMTLGSDGTLNLNDNILQRANLKDYGEITSALGSAGGSRTINLEDGNSFSATVSASTVTWTFSNPTASDELCGFTLTLVNGGSQTVNWPGSVDWAGGSAPSLTSSGTDILVFMTIDGGTIWYGMIASTDAK